MHATARRTPVRTLAPALLAGLLVLAIAAPAAPASASPTAPAAPPVPSSEIIALTGTEGQPTAAADGSRTRPSAPATASAGWTARVDVADGTQGVGIAWDGSVAATIAVRGQGPDGWTAWEDHEGEPGEGPDTAARTGTELIWFGTDGVDQVELRIRSGRLSGLELQAIRSPVDPTAAADAAPAAAADADGRPVIQPRSSWTSQGWVASPGCTPGPVAHPAGIDFAVVHHTVNSNTYSQDEVPAMLRAIYAYDAGTLQWCDMAYHFIVDRFGRIWEGRSGGAANPIIGTHAKGFNRGSVGVALLGQHHPGAAPAAVTPSSAALQAVGRVIGWKLSLHGLSPYGTATTTSSGSSKYAAGTVVTINRVSGHRDTQLTSCPGDLAYAQLATIRSAAASYQASMPAATGALAPFRTPGTFVTQQYRDVLRRVPTQERYDSWTAKVGSTASPASLVTYLAQSSDADSLLHGTTRLYRAYFLRNPDHSGFTYWTDRRAAGTTLARISNTFAASSEFTNRYGALSDADFVRRIYQNVLGRAPDASGEAYWTKRLQGGEARGVVMLNFSESSEYRRKTKAGNEVVALYETLLRRAVTDGAYATLVDDLAAGRRTMEDVAESLLVSGSYRKRFAHPS